MKSMSVIVPTFNERDNIAILVNQIEKSLDGIEYEIVFVDDSTDDTPAKIKEIMENDSHVKLYHRENERGLASAVLLGFNMAKGDYIACMDADLQHPASILFTMYVAMETGADFCIPSRLIYGGNDGGLNLYRKLISWSAKMIGKIILPCLRPISDPTSGLFVLKKVLLDNADLRPIGWKIMIEVLAATRYHRVIEVPYTFRERVAGESKIDTKVMFQYVKQCIGLRKRYVKNRLIVKRWTPSKCDKMIQKYRTEKLGSGYQ